MFDQFGNRTEAGRELAQALMAYGGRNDAITLGFSSVTRTGAPQRRFSIPI